MTSTEYYTDEKAQNSRSDMISFTGLELESQVSNTQTEVSKYASKIKIVKTIPQR